MTLTKLWRKQPPAPTRAQCDRAIHTLTQLEHEYPDDIIVVAYSEKEAAHYHEIAAHNNRHNVRVVMFDDIKDDVA